jgi:Flp pilus assembly CpaF family ATPase
MVLMAVQMPWDAIRSLVASALDIMVFLKRTGSGARIVQEIAVITQKQTGLIDAAPVFIRDSRGRLTRV